MGDTKPTDPSLGLPKDAPADLRDFLACTGGTVTLTDGAVTWIVLDDIVPEEAKAFIPKGAKPSLTIEPGTAPGTATIKVGVAGFTVAELPTSISNGQIAVDLGGLPGLVPQAAKDRLQQQIDNLNAWFKANGKQLAAPAFGAGQVSLSKVPLTATTAPETYLEVPIAPPTLPPASVVAPGAHDGPATGAAGGMATSTADGGTAPAAGEKVYRSLYPEGAEPAAPRPTDAAPPPAPKVEPPKAVPAPSPGAVGSAPPLPDFNSMSDDELKGWLSRISDARYGDEPNTDLARFLGALATAPDERRDHAEFQIKRILERRQAERDEAVRAVAPLPTSTAIKPAPTELRNVGGRWRIYTIVAALVVGILGFGLANALGVFTGNPAAQLSTPSPAAPQATVAATTLVEPTEFAASQAPAASAGPDLSKIQWKIQIGAAAGSTGGVHCGINITANVNILALGASAEEDQALYDAVFGKTASVDIGGPGLPSHVDVPLVRAGENEAPVGKIGNATSGATYTMTLVSAAGTVLNLHATPFTNPCPPS